MRKPLRERLGGKQWFFLLMIVVGWSVVVHGLVTNRSFNTVGGAVVIAIYAVQIVQLIRDVRLARYLKDHLDIAKTYYAGY